MSWHVFDGMTSSRIFDFMTNFLTVMMYFDFIIHKDVRYFMQKPFGAPIKDAC